MYVFQHRSLKSETPIWMGSSHAYELYFLFGVPFFNESVNIPWYGYRLNQHYFRVQDQEVSNYTMHLFATAFYDLRMGYASAMAYVLFLIIAGLTWVATRISRDRMN